MKTYRYPAIFYYEDLAYQLYFPDINGASTYGNSFEEAMKHAEEVLEGMILCSIEDKIFTLQNPSSPFNMKLNVDKKEFIVIIEVTI